MPGFEKSSPGFEKSKTRTAKSRSASGKRHAWFGEFRREFGKSKTRSAKFKPASGKSEPVCRIQAFDFENENQASANPGLDLPNPGSHPEEAIFAMFRYKFRSARKKLWRIATPNKK
jgi:hypothetical protein